MPTIDNLVVLAQVLRVTMDDIVVTRMISVEIDDTEGVEVLSSNTPLRVVCVFGNYLLVRFRAPGIHPAPYY